MYQQHSLARQATYKFAAQGYRLSVRFSARIAHVYFRGSSSGRALRLTALNVDHGKITGSSPVYVAAVMGMFGRIREKVMVVAAGSAWDDCCDC